MLFDRIILLILSVLFAFRLVKNGNIILSSPGHIIDFLVIPLAVILFLSIARKPDKQNTGLVATLGVVISYTALMFLHHTTTKHTGYTNIVALAASLFYSILLVISYCTIGRNLGVFPGKRGIVKIGTFSLVRHPIYSCHLHLALCYLAIYPSWTNMACFFMLSIGILIRSVKEEEVLSTSDEYKDHAKTVSWRYFSLALTLPLLVLASFSSHDYLIASPDKQDHTDPIKLQIAYPVLSLNPTVYDDWGSVFVGNHIYRRLIKDSDLPEMPYIAEDFKAQCSDGSADAFAQNCPRIRITFKFTPFQSCDGSEYLKNDIKHELELILNAKTWILPNWSFCEEASDGVCIDADNGKDLLRRLRSLYPRFGWIKSAENGELFGAGKYCLKVDRRENSAISKGTISKVTSTEISPVLKFWTSTDKKDKFDVALYGSDNLLSDKRKNIHTQTPTGYYLVTNKRYKKIDLPWNRPEVQQIIAEHLNKIGLISYRESSYLLKLLPKGKATEQKFNAPFATDAKAEIVLPDYFTDCSRLSQKLNDYFAANAYGGVKAICQDLLVFQKNHVWPVSGDGKFHAFVSPLSPGAAGPNAIRYQYFSPLSKESYTSNYSDPDELFYLVGVGPSYVTVDGQRFCDVKPNSMGLGNIMIDDFLECK